MPNIGVVLKQEIVRLAKREIRADLQSTRKASAQYRRQIAALKRQVATLERNVAALRRASGKAVALTADAVPTKMRFVAKGLKSHRTRLGLSAADLGKLVGVTAQSIYNWEQGKATPRAEQLKAIALLRGAGKRDVQKKLDAMTPAKSPARKK